MSNVDYARVYDPNVDRLHETVAGNDVRDNLVCESQPGFNYERERQQGDGNDWV
jgi:hypothetical protein